MPPSSVPRLCLSALTGVGAVLAQRELARRRSGRSAARPSHAVAEQGEVAALAHAAPGPKAVAGAPAVATGLRAGPRHLLAALHSVSRALHVLRSVWLSVALGAVASWAVVSEKVAGALSQLQFADAHKAALPEVAINTATVAQFCGRWNKVPARCESMDGFCQLFGVPRWLRQATRLMTGLDISMTDEALVVKQLCRISWLSTVEAFPLDGSCSAPHKRRDMRGGKQVGRLLSAQDGAMQLAVVLHGALPGAATDTLRLQAGPQGGSELVVQHEASIQGRGAARFTEVFRPAGPPPG